MAKHKKDSVGEDWLEYSRDLAKAEKELQIEKWVFISIGYRNDTNELVKLYHFDLPRSVYENHRWVVRWRCARLQCVHPRYEVHCCFSYYDRRTGLKTRFGSCLTQLAAARAQVTKAERSIEKYIEYQTKKYPLFGYDPDTDPDLDKYRLKLETKKQKLAASLLNIQNAVESHRADQNATGIINYPHPNYQLSANTPQ